MSAESAEERTNGRGDPWRKAAIAIVILVAIIVVPQWWLRLQFAAVPDVIGMPRSDAERQIRAAGFEIGDSTHTLAEPGEKIGLVVQQSPGPGDRRMRGSAVDMVVAEAPSETTSTPSGDSEPIIGPPPVTPDEGRKTDNVTAAPESPPVNSGAQVPQGIGKSASDAGAALRGAGYAVVVKSGPSSTDVAKGVVYRQVPAPGAYEPRGTTVTIWVSTGPPR